MSKVPSTPWGSLPLEAQIAFVGLAFGVLTIAMVVLCACGYGFLLCGGECR